MDKDTVNQDRNLLGRIGAVVVLAAVLAGLGRLCGMDGACPLTGGHMCPYFSRPASPR